MIMIIFTWPPVMGRLVGGSWALGTSWTTAPAIAPASTVTG